MCAFVIPFMSRNSAWMSWETALDPVLLEKIIMEACHLLTSPAAFSIFLKSVLDPCMLDMALLLVVRFLVIMEVVFMVIVTSTAALQDFIGRADCHGERGPWDEASSIWLIIGHES